MLQTDEGSAAVYATNDDNELRLLFWQSSEMHSVYDKFPEALFLVSCSAKSIGMPLYCMCVQDGAGNGRVCGYGLASDETHQSMYTLLELFCEKNPAVWQLSAVFVDKSFTEIECILQIFPNATIQIGTKGFRRVEAHIKQIKTAVTNCGSLHKLFEALLHLGSSMSVECEYKQAVSLSKLDYQHDSTIQPEVTELISATCTPYAADLVIRQLNAAVENRTNATVFLAQSEAFVSVDGCNFCAIDSASMTCNCVFNNTTKLPCEHVFLLRASSDLDWFSAELIPQRWRKPAIATGVVAVSRHSNTAEVDAPAQRNDVLSKTDKHELLTNVCVRLTDIVCSVGHDEFRAKLGLLEELVGLWSNDAAVTLAVVSNADTATVLDASSQADTATVADPSVSTSTVVPTSSTSLYCQSSAGNPTSATVLVVADDATSAHCSRPLAVSRTVPDSIQLSFAAPAAGMNLKNIRLPVRSAVCDRPREPAATVIQRPKRKTAATVVQKPRRKKIKTENSVPHTDITEAILTDHW